MIATVPFGRWYFFYLKFHLTPLFTCTRCQSIVFINIAGWCGDSSAGCGNLIQQNLPTKVWWVNQTQQHTVHVNDPQSSASYLGNLLCVLSGRWKVVIGAVVLPVVVLICVFQVNGGHGLNRSGSFWWDSLGKGECLRFCSRLQVIGSSSLDICRGPSCFRIAPQRDSNANTNKHFQHDTTSCSLMILVMVASDNPV